MKKKKKTLQWETFYQKLKKRKRKNKSHICFVKFKY